MSTRLSMSVAFEFHSRHNVCSQNPPAIRLYIWLVSNMILKSTKACLNSYIQTWQVQCTCLYNYIWLVQQHVDLLHLFVHYNSNSSLGDIKNTTSFAMINFVRHSFVDGTINLDKKINNHDKIYLKDYIAKAFQVQGMILWSMMNQLHHSFMKNKPCSL